MSLLVNTQVAVGERLCTWLAVIIYHQGNVDSWGITPSCEFCLDYCLFILFSTVFKAQDNLSRSVETYEIWVKDMPIILKSSINVLPFRDLCLATLVTIWIPGLKELLKDSKVEETDWKRSLLSFLCQTNNFSWSWPSTCLCMHQWISSVNIWWRYLHHKFWIF